MLLRQFVALFRLEVGGEVGAEPLVGQFERDLAGLFDVGGDFEGAEDVGLLEAELGELLVGRGVVRFLLHEIILRLA